MTVAVVRSVVVTLLFPALVMAQKIGVLPFEDASGVREQFGEQVAKIIRSEMLREKRFLPKFIKYTPEAEQAAAVELPISRSTATTAARGGLAERGFAPAPPWRELSSVEGSVGLSDRFVWQEGGRESYRRVLGTHLAPPVWLVRYAKFEGDVAERADEYQIWIGADAKLVRVEHTLPEGREGKALEQEQARSIAHDVLRAKFGLDPTALEEVSAEPSQLPKRRDWKFVFADPKVDVGGKVSGRVPDFIYGIAICWLYTALAARYGASFATALRASALVFVVGAFTTYLGIANSGLLPWDLAADTPLLAFVVFLPGAWLVDRLMRGHVSVTK